MILEIITDTSINIIEKFKSTKKMFGIKKAEFPIDEVTFKKKISQDKEHHWGEEANQDNIPETKSNKSKLRGIGTLSKGDVEFIDILNNIISKNPNVKKSDILIEIKRAENLKINKERAVELTNYYFDKKK